MLSKVYDKKASSSPVMFAHTDCHPLLSAVLLHRLANDFKFQCLFQAFVVFL